jgi:hypothetical protein
MATKKYKGTCHHFDFSCFGVVPSWGEYIYSCLSKWFMSLLIDATMWPCSSRGCYRAIFDEVTCLATMKACPSSSSTLSNVRPPVLRTCGPLSSLEHGKVPPEFLPQATAHYGPLYRIRCLRHQYLFPFKSSNTLPKSSLCKRCNIHQSDEILDLSEGHPRIVLSSTPHKEQDSERTLPVP